ncbi:unnamed protein product [Hydatigera taeniaeformis]|uniref:Uncharacterized protein n=1 Tax=Hydatigena taeniaeformis TaxID=6205 RepID=A0A3P7G027_HYDTA|nr:unnamed protein product [Hydatigera taeniaeformis]
MGVAALEWCCNTSGELSLHEKDCIHRDWQIWVHGVVVAPLRDRRALVHVRRASDSLRNLKWLDRHLCGMLFGQGTEVSFSAALQAIHYYTHKDAFYHQVWMRGFPAGVCTPIRCMITTPCHYKRLLATTMTKYMCTLPLGRCEKSIAVYVDVSSDVPGFGDWWETFIQAEGGTIVEKSEWWARDREGRERMRLSNHDCVILDVDYEESEEDRKYLNALVDIQTPQQVFAVTGTLSRIGGLTSNFDHLKQMFWHINGFAFVPFSNLPTNWRIWCNKYQNHSTINFVEIVKWACLDVLVRRNEASVVSNVSMIA